MHICLGAFRTFPVEGLYVEANEPRLELRRKKKLSLQCAIELKGYLSNPAFDCVFNSTNETLYENVNRIRPFGLRVMT